MKKTILMLVTIMTVSLWAYNSVQVLGTTVSKRSNHNVHLSWSSGSGLSASKTLSSDVKDWVNPATASGNSGWNSEDKITLEISFDATVTKTKLKVVTMAMDDKYGKYVRRRIYQIKEDSSECQVSTSVWYYDRRGNEKARITLLTDSNNKPKIKFSDWSSETHNINSLKCED